MEQKEQYDVVVVGGGSAAFETAISAKMAGAERVLMLEKAPEAEFGGNARFSHTGFRFVHSGAEEVRSFVANVDESRFQRMHIPAYTAEEFHADLARVTLGRVNPVLARCLVEQSNAAVHWLKEIGVAWEFDKTITVGDKLYFEPGFQIHPVGGGLNLVLRLREIALRAGIEIRYRSRVSALHGDDRHVEGVRVSTPERVYDLGASAIILCSGGFQANPEMRARYLGPNADLVKVRGSKHDTGEVLQQALGLGARAAGHWQVAHTSPIDGKAPDYETPMLPDGRGNRMNRYDYPYGITVNAVGQRFIDEGESKISYTYAKVGRAVLSEPGSVAYQIYDQTGIGLFKHGRDYPATMVEAPTIAELAKKIGMHPEVLEDTVTRFNQACPETPAFDPREPDGRSTTGLVPPKSNWAVPLVKGPFRAYPITAGVTFTFGGLEVDDQARVISTNFEPIRGLYASGDIIGLFFHNYPACTGQTRNVVFSYLAGRNAAGRLNT